jgi:hypothetical protein
LIIEDGTDRFSRNVGKKLLLYCVISQKSADNINVAAKSRNDPVLPLLTSEIDGTRQ